MASVPVSGWEDSCWEEGSTGWGRTTNTDTGELIVSAPVCSYVYKVPHN